MARVTLALLLLLTIYDARSESFQQDIVKAALERANHTVRYDGSYRANAYTCGDIPADIGVCTDVIIRTYRAMVGAGPKLEDILFKYRITGRYRYIPSQYQSVSNPHE